MWDPKRWLFCETCGYFQVKVVKIRACLTKVKLLDTAEGYQDSVQIQLIILLLQIDQVDQLKKLGWQPNLVAGHSLGIFAAAYAAGVINKEDVFKLVALRTKQMQECYPEDYGMGVVVGLSRPEVKKLVAQVHSENDSVFIFLIKIRKRRTRFLEQWVRSSKS